MVSIIIVSYNRLDLVKKCLSAVVKNAPKDSEVILVDNNSSEDIADLVKKEFPKVKLILNKTNAGFAVGNNQGMKAAKGDYFMLLNTDAFIEKDTIPELVNFLESHPDAGIVGPQLLNTDGSIQPSVGFFPHLWQMFLAMTVLDNLPLIKKFAPANHVRYLPALSKPRTFGWITGACILLPKKVFEETGGMDENYFMYGEELEWLYRINLAGYKVYYDPKTCVTHIGFASSNPGNGAIKELQSVVFFYKKYKPAWQMPILLGLLTFGCLLRICRGLIFPKHRWMIKTYAAAITKIL